MFVFDGRKSSAVAITKQLEYLRKNGTTVISATDLLKRMGNKLLSTEEISNKFRSAGWTLDGYRTSLPTFSVDKLEILDVRNQSRHGTTLATASIFDTTFWLMSLPIVTLENISKSWDIEEDELRNKDVMGMLQLFGRYCWQIAIARRAEGPKEEIAIPGMTRHIAFIREIYLAIEDKPGYWLKSTESDLIISM